MEHNMLAGTYRGIFSNRFFIDNAMVKVKIVGDLPVEMIYYGRSPR